MMKIAVLSDIHSNLMALDMVLADARSRNVSQYIFCGDYISDGPDTERIFQRIRSLPAAVIRGNREDYMQAHAKGKSPVWQDSMQFSSLNWVYNRLSRESLNYIKTLPPTKRLRINKRSILISHGSPYLAREVVNPYRSTQCLDRISEDFGDDIFIFGHTHKQWQMEYKGRLFLNPGSVGMPTDSRGFKYSILELGDAVHVDEITLPFSYDELAEYYKTSGFLADNGIWGKIFLHTIRDGVNYVDRFLAFCHDYARRQGADTTAQIPNVLFEEATAKWEKNNWRVAI